MSTPGTASPTAMLTDLLDLGIQLGRDMLAALRTDQPATHSVDVLRRGVATAPVGRLLPAMQTCGCDIPPPCWMPRDLGQVVSHGCPGAKAQLRFRVTNCGPGDRTVTVEPRGAGAKLVVVDPASVQLGTYEQGTVTASMDIPDQGATSVDTLLWVHGCREHVLRWRVEVSDAGCSSVHELDVEDCPDYVHHWYDHFYCARPCGHAGTITPSHG